MPVIRAAAAAVLMAVLDRDVHVQAVDRAKASLLFRSDDTLADRG